MDPIIFIHSKDLVYFYVNNSNLESIEKKIKILKDYDEELFWDYLIGEHDKSLQIQFDYDLIECTDLLDLLIYSYIEGNEKGDIIW